MTPLPKRKHSTRRAGKRRAAISFTFPKLVSCANCKQPTLPHQACRSCGYYKKPVPSTKPAPVTS